MNKTQLVVYEIAVQENGSREHAEYAELGRQSVCISYLYATSRLTTFLRT